MMSLLDFEYTLKASYTRHSAHQYSTSYHTNYLLLLSMLSLAELHCLSSRSLLPLACKSLSSPHSTPSERFASSAFVEVARMPPLPQFDR